MIRYNYTHLSHIFTKDDIKIFSKLFFCCKEELDNKYYTNDYGDKKIPKLTFHNMYSVINYTNDYGDKNITKCTFHHMDSVMNSNIDYLFGIKEKREYILYYNNMHLYLEGILNKSKELLSTNTLTNVTEFFDLIVEIQKECRNNNIDMLFAML